MKQFIIKSFIIIFPTLILFWNFTNYEISGGDLNRIGKISIEKDYRKIFEKEFTKTIRYKKPQQLDLKKENNFDVVTIGDSFSLQKKYGYQNSIAELGNLKILSISDYNGENPIEVLNSIVNGNLFEKLKTKYVILESVERSFAIRGMNINKDNIVNIEDLRNIKTYDDNVKYKSKKKEITLEIFQDRMKYFVYNLLYNFDEKAFMSKVYKVKLTKKLFSTQKNELLFFEEDINNLIYSNEENIVRLNKELNLLSEKLEKKGVKLIVLPGPDKYDMYYDYIENNKLPKNNFFEYMNEMPKKYIYINSKELLLKHIANGEKDIYFADDTHWSPYGVKIIVEEILQKMALN